MRVLLPLLPERGDGMIVALILAALALLAALILWIVVEGRDNEAKLR